jgi:hypothetical protein
MTENELPAYKSVGTVTIPVVPMGYRSNQGFCPIQLMKPNCKTVWLQVAAQGLFAFYGFKKGFEIAFTE